MDWLLIGMALLLASAITVIGIGYIARPFAMTPSFGLPLPDGGATIPAWLRLKGVRDIASGLLVIGFMLAGDHRAVGLVLLLASVIPLGDMLVVLTAGGSRGRAFGIHGVTALVMVLTALPLMGGQGRANGASLGLQ